MPEIVSSPPSSNAVTAHQGPILTTAPRCPLTQDRPLRQDTDVYIPKPFVARARDVPSVSHPQGETETPRSDKLREYSVMQQHTLFWDRDGDGVIWPFDTFAGFRELGFNVLFSLLAVFVINGGFSLPTRLGHTFLPDPFFRIYVSTIHKDKHGSDSGVFDPEGRFLPSSFEDVFYKFSKSASRNTLSLGELFAVIAGNRCAMDPFGWTAAFFEWGTAWLLLQKDGRIEKEDLRKLYNGSLFWEISDKRKTKAGWKKGWGLGGDGFIGGGQPFATGDDAE